MFTIIVTVLAVAALAYVGYLTLPALFNEYRIRRM